MNPLLFRITICLLLVAIALAITGRAQAETCCRHHADSDASNPAASDSNVMCPVMPEELAEDSWTTVYRGRVIRFCCNNCVDTFRRNPEKFLSALPQFARAGQPEPGGYRINMNMLRFLALFIGSLVVCGLSWHWNRRRVDAGKLTLLKPLLIQAALALAIAATIQLTLRNQNLQLEMIKQRAVSDIHHATYYDYGVPPIPHRPEIAPALSATFYRGNDERSPILHNGGNYQTAVFDLQLEHADGRAVSPGDRLSADTLFLKFTIRKARNSPLRMYNNKIMDKIYLTKSYDPLMGWDEPIEDQRHICGTVPGEVWECRFPLAVSIPHNAGDFDPQSVTRQQLKRIDGIDAEVADWFVAYRDAGYPIVSPDDLRQAGITGESAQILAGSLNEATHEGVVYVCEAFFHRGRQMGARIHYGIKYDIRTKNGVILDDSEIWMGALSRSQKAAKGAIPDMQWLSSDPLPELPEPQQISDELLGIDDYDW